MGITFPSWNWSSSRRPFLIWEPTALWKTVLDTLYIFQIIPKNWIFCSLLHLCLILLKKADGTFHIPLGNIHHYLIKLMKYISDFLHYSSWQLYQIFWNFINCLQSYSLLYYIFPSLPWPSRSFQLSLEFSSKLWLLLLGPQINIIQFIFLLGMV